jgi:hypothetical protein
LSSRLLDRFQFLNLSLNAIWVATRKFFIASRKLLSLSLLQTFLLFLFPVRRRRIYGPLLVLGHTEMFL